MAKKHIDKFMRSTIAYRRQLEDLEDSGVFKEENVDTLADDLWLSLIRLQDTLSGKYYEDQNIDL